MEIVQVITREGTNNNTIDYHDNGKYQQILYDRKNNFSVFVKVKVYKEQNEQDKKDELYWNAAFFSSADEARKKAEELHKIAKQQSRMQ
jgi:formylmethanofuran dehydrogenase subunit E